MVRIIILALAITALVLGMTAVRGAEMLSVDVGGEHFEGTPLSWSSTTVNLLSRDGQLLSFSPSEAKNARKSGSSFLGYSVADLRSQLTREFGNNFEVTGTGHYLVVHPRGQRDYWAPRFEELYRSFVHYFSVRGMKVTEPAYPLVAIVWKNQTDYLKYARNEGANIGPNVSGYYSPKTNRITLYDAGGGSASSANWANNSDVIIHEATHQTAFNTGVHRRFSDAPRWLVEGLATTFEAPGVWDSRNHPGAAERINRGRLGSYQRMVKAGKTVDLAELVASDRIFDQDPERAYAYAWALSYYLVEQQPREYAKYLAITADRAAFASVPPNERLADFTKAFGVDFKQLKSRFDKFMTSLN